MIDLTHLLFSPRGRIGRQTYWTLAVLVLTGGVMLSLIPFFGDLVSLGVQWPLACVVSQRLHDGGRRAWPLVPAILLNVVAALFSFVATMLAATPATVVAAFGLAAPVLLLSGLSITVTLIVMLAAGLSHSARGANRFGEPEALPVSFATLLQIERF